jgi:serine/threonine-protein kinase
VRDPDKGPDKDPSTPPGAAGVMTSEPEALVGTCVAGHYQVEAILGRGGMGVVYRAVDGRTGREVAIKTLCPEGEEGAELVARFQREAEVTHLLNHPHIVEVVSMGVLDDSALFLVMELVEGESVDRLIEDRAIGPRRALVITRQVLLALHHAHQHGMVHRDLKPENIMIVQAGQPGNTYDHVKLLDFGLVKLVDDMASGMGFEKLTRTGIIYGTPAYIAPEQALGRVLDGRADLYSLGVTLFEILTGRLPFMAEDPMDTLRMHVTVPPPKLSTMCPGAAWCTAQMEHLVACALAKTPELRFDDAREMMEAVDAAFLSISELPPER